LNLLHIGGLLTRLIFLGLGILFPCYELMFKTYAYQSDCQIKYEYFFMGDGNAREGVYNEGDDAHYTPSIIFGIDSNLLTLHTQ